MSWVTVVWSMVVSACFTLAAIHLSIWWSDRAARANAALALAALAVAGTAAGEFLMMRADTPAEFTAIMRVALVSVVVMFAALVCFVRFGLHTGRLWLGGGAVGLRVLVAIATLGPRRGSPYGEISSLMDINFLGESVSVVAERALSPWAIVNEVSVLCLFLFVVDASVSIWRAGGKEDRRRACLVGGAIALFLLTGGGTAALINHQVLHIPYLISPSFLAIVAVMNYELGRDVLKAARLSDALAESEERVTLAAEAADLGLWVWDVAANRIWGSERWLGLFGFAPDQTVSYKEIIQRIHADDRGMVDRDVRRALQAQGDVALEYRVTLPDGSLRWVAARGRMAPAAAGRPPRILGVAIDVTGRKHSELELERQRSRLIHLSRLSVLGEWSGSIAHELSQPLTAILSNAQAAQRFMAYDQPDLLQVSEALADIVAEVSRASKVIERLRPLFRRGEVRREPLEANHVVLDALKLMRGELLNRGTSEQTELAPDLPVLCGDPIQIQQVLINLVTNACDAMAGAAPDDRRVLIRTGLGAAGQVHVSVTDRGTGIPPDQLEEIFVPFHTTKARGMGLGLAVCRTIVTAHGGRIWAVNNPEGGATVHVTLPAAGEGKGAGAALHV